MGIWNLIKSTEHIYSRFMLTQYSTGLEIKLIYSAHFHWTEGFTQGYLS